MKKYLMSGVAAIAFLAAFTSCSKTTDLYEEGRKEKDQAAQNETKVAQSYEEAFEAAFGKPAANQDWGLAKYGTPKAAGTRSSVTTVVEPDNKNKPKPGEPGFSSEITMPTQYKNTLAEAKTIPGIEALHSNYTKNGTYYIEASNWDNNNPGAIDIQNRALTLYFDGDITFYGNNDQNDGTVYCVTENSILRLQSVRNHLIVYLAPGATLDLTQVKDWSGNPVVATFQNTDSGIFLCEGSSVIAKDIAFVGGSKIRNNGYIEADNLTLNGQNSVNSSLWNEGEVKVKETLTLYNQDGEFINRNKLTAKNLDMRAGGRFLNVGTTNITGTSYIMNSNSQWENEGEYTCGTFQIENAQRVYNNCNLTATTFTMNTRGQFVLQGGDSFGASVVCDNFTFGDDCDFWLGNKSLLSVKNELTVAHADRGYGFRGEGNSSYAVIKAGSIAKAAGMNPDWSLSYYGKLFIDTPTHFAYDTDHAHPRYVWDSDVMFSFQGDDCPVVIAKDEIGKCNPGYKQKKNITYQGRIMGEDLTAENDNDFDFNDVVFDWAFSTDGKTAYIKLYACGGTMPLKIGKAVGEGEEVHALFNVGTGTMVNTGVGTSGITKEPVEFTITSETEGTFRTAADIIVSVDKTKKGAAGYMQMTAKIGDAPCLLFVPLETKWVDEYVNIEKAYTWFGAWARGEVNDQWTSAPVGKYVNLDLSDND